MSNPFYLFFTTNLLISISSAEYIMLLFVSVFTFIILICCLTVMALSIHNYKSYKETYEALVSYEYTFINDPYQSVKTYQTYLKKDDIVNDVYSYPYITLLSDGSVRLLNRGTLVNSFLSYLDPYSAYYLIKFKKWKKQYGGIEYTLDIKRDRFIEEILKCN